VKVVATRVVAQRELVDSGHQGRRNVHGLVRGDERGDAACAQIEQDQEEDSRKKREEPEEQVSPVGDKGERAVLRGPKEGNDQEGHPSATGERLQPG
jgi:hypothetical protein